MNSTLQAAPGVYVTLKREADGSLVEALFKTSVISLTLNGVSTELKTENLRMTFQKSLIALLMAYVIA
ncbi:MAG: hypothetical protein Q8S55_01055 [Methylococcaceae bacterium]|nr:hypothetical protein [Methylococcaceae bacterium]